MLKHHSPAAGGAGGFEREARAVHNAIHPVASRSFLCTVRPSSAVVLLEERCICARHQYRTIAALYVAHTASLVSRICVERFRRDYKRATGTYRGSATVLVDCTAVVIVPVACR